jgi:cystathionine gamma-synthase
MTKLHPSTIAAQAGGAVEPQTGAIVSPIHLATTYIRDPDNAYSRGYIYGRPDNATVREAESVLCQLEGGSSALILASGMAAATTAFLALERPAHVIAPTVMYWALRNWLVNDAPAHGIEATIVDASDPKAVAAAIRPGNTRMVWLETPGNPLWTLSDIAETARIAHAGGALLGVDSTAATPVLTQPLALGADVVMHSATKYLNGHSDVIAGALVLAREDDYAARVRRVRSMLGSVLGPFEAALLVRGMRTLYLRVRHQCEAARQIAEAMTRNDRIGGVLYPGLASHPGREIAAKQMTGGFGGMLSIRVAAGEQAAVRTAANVKIWKRATSLGGVESLMEHRASIEGAGSPCPTDLLRLSVGLEDPADLIRDLEQALIANA